MRVGVVAAVVLMGLALATSTLAARELPGSAMRVMTALTEPAALLIWGSALAALSHLMGRKG